MRGMVWLLGLVGCGGLTPLGSSACLDDYDADGICDAIDVCPYDRFDDADQDGICGDVDVCDQGDDTLDGDGDGVADACDSCPTIEGVDDDGDGLCGDEDPCPDDANNQCGRPVVIALQVDQYFDESTWRITDRSSSLVDMGEFEQGGQVVYLRQDLPANEPLTLTLSDAVGDGGIRGFIWDRLAGVMVEEWELRDWNSGKNFTFTLDAEPHAEGLQAAPQTVAQFGDGFTWCAVDFVLDFSEGGSLAYPQEVGYDVMDSRETYQGGVLTNTFSTADRGTTKTTTLELWEGDYRVDLFDALSGTSSSGDGWWSETLSVVVDGTAVASGWFIDRNAAQRNTSSESFTLDCP